MENDVVDLEKKKKEVEQQREKLVKKHKEKLNTVFATSEGLYVLKQMAINSRFFEPNLNSANPNDLYFALGKRRLFLDTYVFLNNDIKKKLINEIYTQ